MTQIEMEFDIVNDGTKADLIEYLSDMDPSAALGSMTPHELRVMLAELLLDSTGPEADDLIGLIPDATPKAREAFKDAWDDEEKNRQKDSLPLLRGQIAAMEAAVFGA